MTDSNDSSNRGRPRGRPGQGRASGGRPFSKNRPEGGKRPFRSREGDERPPRKPFGDKPFRSRNDERPRRFDHSAEERPRRPARPPIAPPETVPEEPAEERIAKVIARAGVASRRDAEAMIAEGRVTVNGTVIESPALNVTRDDKITVDGEPLPMRERTRLWIFHKPRGLVTTARDPEGRPTVFEALPEDMPRVVAVGRLDINTEGLLLLTNDGGLARVIAHPDTGWLRRYKVRAHGDITQADLDRLQGGVTVDGMEYGPVEAKLDRVQGDNVWITMGLREGKNREVKRILEHLGLQVNRLIRLSFGPFQLGDLEPGLVEEVRTRVLKDQLGEALAVEAGVDFTSPVREPIAPFGTKPQRDERGERPREAREERRFDDRPPRRSRDERPARGRREEEEAPPPKRYDRLAPKRSVWRAGEDEAEPRLRKAPPRRGADPREARAANAERPRERVGAIKAGEGRKVVVERLASVPEPEETSARKPRAPRRDEAPRGDQRRERPFRSREGDERPRRPREGERPFRSRESSEDRLRRGPPRGDGPTRGGFKGGPRGGGKGGFKSGGKGGFKGGSKGPPRGRRP